VKTGRGGIESLNFKFYDFSLPNNSHFKHFVLPCVKTTLVTLLVATVYPGKTQKNTIGSNRATHSREHMMRWQMGFTPFTEFSWLLGLTHLLKVIFGKNRLMSFTPPLVGVERLYI